MALYNTVLKKIMTTCFNLNFILPLLNQDDSTDPFSFNCFSLFAMSGAISSWMTILFPFNSLRLRIRRILVLLETNFTITGLGLTDLWSLALALLPCSLSIALGWPILWTISISSGWISSWRCSFAKLTKVSSAIHGLPVTLRMFGVKFDKSDWFWSQSIVFTKPFKNGMSLDEARGREWSGPNYTTAVHAFVKATLRLGLRARFSHTCS